MKIAMFSDCYLDFTGGIVTVMNAQKKALEALGHTVYIFTTGYPRSKKKIRDLARENVFVVPSCKVFFWKLSPISRRPGIIEKWLLREHPELKNFDIFYTHYEAGCSIAGLRLGRRLQIPVVQMMHGREDMGETHIIPRGLRTLVAVFLNWFHSWYLPHPIKIKRDDFLADSLAKAKMWSIMVNHANTADVVITPSQHFAEKLKHYGVSQKIMVVPNGLSSEWFPTAVPVRKSEAGKPLKIIWHSRVSSEKRIMPFLKALALAPAGSWRLDVFGGGGDAFRARRFAKRRGMPVRFHGNTRFATLHKKLLEADLDVLVSYGFDTFGMTLIEAEAAGVPVLICDPDLLEVIPSGGGVLASGPAVEEMAAAIKNLIAHPEKISKMSAIMIQHREEVLMLAPDDPGPEGREGRIKRLVKIFEDIIQDG